MYGYLVPYGYKGLINGKWMLFSTENEYAEYYEENSEYSKEESDHEKE